MTSLITASSGKNLPGSTFIKLAVAIALLVYPITIYFAAGHLTPSQLLAGLLLLFAARLLIAVRIAGTHPVLYTVAAGLLALAAAAILVWVQELAMRWLRFYPMLLDLSVFGVFFGSLFSRMPLVERFARVFRADLPPHAVRYTRRVTWAWCGLLLAVAVISLYTTVSSSLRAWSLLNGVIVYVIFGAAFAGEYLLRIYMRRKWEARG